MSRAALLPFPGDPFLFNYWLKFFDRVWGGEVDKLYIGMNSPIEPMAIDYIKQTIVNSIYASKIVFDYQDHMADHGPTITRLLSICYESHVVLLEDDCFIFKPGMLNQAFESLENGRFDLVGSKRGSCHNEILQASQAEYGISYDGEGDQGPNFWPNLLFTTKELLLKTDGNFAAKAWHRDDVITQLNHTVEDEVIYGDTFVWASIQLRGMLEISRIGIIPQYHGSPDDLEHALKGRYIFDGQAPWVHVGSLSSGISGVLRDEQNRALDRRLLDEPKGERHLPDEWCTSEGEKKEWERRVSMWLTFYEYASPAGSLVELYNLYFNGIRHIINQYQLDMIAIHRRQKLYKGLMNV